MVTHDRRGSPNVRCASARNSLNAYTLQSCHPYCPQRLCLGLSIGWRMACKPLRSKAVRERDGWNSLKGEKVLQLKKTKQKTTEAYREGRRAPSLENRAVLRRKIYHILKAVWGTWARLHFHGLTYVDLFLLKMHARALSWPRGNKRLAFLLSFVPVCLP